jgi:integrase/recombinase XerD
MPTATATRARKPSAEVLKSPHAAPSSWPGRAGPAARTAPGQVNLSVRQATIAEFTDHLRTTTNRDKRHYQQASIDAYVYPARNLDAWLSASGFDGDFTTLDTALLNRYFRQYYDHHGQGGTHTLQRNLLRLFKYLEAEHASPSPFGPGLNRYAEVKGRPKTLSADFVGDLLEVTGDGKSRDFETARDHANIRILRSEGIRRQELLSMVMHGLPADVIQNPLIRVVPLKSARAAGEGRLIALAPATARALAIYLRARRTHRQANSDWVWLGTRGRSRFSNTGLRKMLIRRAAEADYEGITPRQFRHTFSNVWHQAGPKAISCASTAGRHGRWWTVTPMMSPTSARSTPSAVKATSCEPPTGNGPAARPAGPEVAAAGPRDARSRRGLVRLGGDRADDRIRSGPPVSRDRGFGPGQHRVHVAARGRGLCRVRAAVLAVRRHGQYADQAVRVLVRDRVVPAGDGRTGGLSAACPGRHGSGAVGGHDTGLVPAGAGPGHGGSAGPHAPCGRVRRPKRDRRSVIGTSSRVVWTGLERGPDQGGDGLVPATLMSSEHSGEADHERSVDQDRPVVQDRSTEVRSIASRLAASGRRVSRRTLRAAGARGSNAELGSIARLVSAGATTEASVRDMGEAP